MKDICALVGLLLLGIGCWLIYQPLALVVVGALLLFGAVFGHLNRGGKR